MNFSTISPSYGKLVSNSGNRPLNFSFSEVRGKNVCKHFVIFNTPSQQIDIDSLFREIWITLLTLDLLREVLF